MKKLVWKLVCAFVVIPAVIVGTMYWLNESGFFNIHKIEVVMDSKSVIHPNFHQPLVEKLEKELGEMKGQSLWTVRLSRVSALVKSENWVERHNIVRSWPNTLQVKIRPYEVKLLFLGKGGRYTPIINDGSFLDSVESKQAPDVTLLEGEVFAQKKELRTKAVKVLKEIPEEGSFSKKTISEMHYDAKDGFSMTLAKTGIRVKIGEEQVALKSARVSQVVDYLQSKQFDARVIDANLSKKVLVRLRKDP